jgi:CRISPR-associated endonuclease/helicase Cas3
MECDHLWKPSSSYDPLGALGALLEEAQRHHRSAFDAAVDLPAATVSVFAGLLTLADWIGSDAALFPLDGVTGAARRTRSQAQARAIVAGRGLGAAGALGTLAAQTSFINAFGLEPPNQPHDMQLRAADSALGSLVILEAETGSGKTEAALWRFLRLLAAGEVDALYFALPTRTSAVQMFGRVQRSLDRVFGEGKVAPVLAVPGTLRAGDMEGVRIDAFETLWPDRREETDEDARWAAEAPKRFLAARVAVGTVDQALMAALRVRHAHLRAASLSRALLVVDEVHASDDYMTGILRRVLANHRAAGGHAMLLSATLGSTARMALLSGKGAGPVRGAPGPAAACLVPYPALHGDLAGIVPVATDGRRKSIALTLEGIIDEPEAIAECALRAAQAGARVLVIRNTVDGALAVQQAMEAHPGAAGHLFEVRGRPTLHHGRFAAEDRRLLDGAIEAAFGKGRAAGPGLVAVGTQTLEVSLDLDADLMIADLAPVDVLLQRLGRLHRHSLAQRGGRGRPPGFEAPAAVIATPSARNLSPYLGRVARRHGLGPRGENGQGVYSNLLAIEATWRLLADLAGRGAPLVVPDDNRRLVEMATHPEALGAIAEELGWAQFQVRHEGRLVSERQLAAMNTFDMTLPFSELGPFPDEEAIRTRLGLDDWRLELEERPMGPFGQPISALRIPGWMVKGLAPETPVSVRAFDTGFEVTVGGETFAYGRLGLRAGGLVAG